MRQPATLGRVLEEHAANSTEPEAVSIQRIMATPGISALPTPLFLSAPAPYTTAWTRLFLLVVLLPQSHHLAHHCVAGFDKPVEHVVRHSPVVVPGPRSQPGSVPGCGRGADAGLRAHLLGQKAAPVLCRLAASVKD